jgi:purine-nucleoside phosphorylase
MISQAHIEETAAFLHNRLGGFQPKIGLILGSGLGLLADEVQNPVVVPYSEIPHFPVSTVAGHAGRLVIGTLEDKPVLVMQGRFHFYEGYPIELLAMPVRVMHLLGVKELVVTNAAGGVNPRFAEGDLMLIRDHLNFAFANPLMGPNLSAFGPRFPDTSQAYSPRLLQLAREVSNITGVAVQEGVYQFMTGPSYETPAEVKMAGSLGADAVGMSTVPEVQAAAHCGMEVLGISYISNLAAGISPKALSHQDVVDTIDSIKDKLINLMRGILRAM